MNRYLPLLALVAALSACVDSPDGKLRCGTSTTQTPVLEDSFQLRFGEPTHISGENLTLTLAQVLADSRCPVGVQCIWEGNARIAVRAAKAPAQPALLELNTNSRYPTQAHYQAYTVQLLHVAPYPEQGNRLAASSYCATLKVKRSSPVIPGL